MIYSNRATTVLLLSNVSVITINLCDQLFQNHSYGHKQLKHSFLQFSIAKPIKNSLKGLVLSTVHRSDLTLAAFSDLSDMSEHSGGL